MKYILKFRDMADRQFQNNPLRVMAFTIAIALIISVWYASLIL